jgi:hypothetical protein
MTLPKISTYGNYSSTNYGAHCLKVDLPQADFYFSYDTLVAFYTHKTGLVCRQNDWSTTTGKHLNIICPNKKERVPAEKFQQIYDETFKN